MPEIPTFLRAVIEKKADAILAEYNYRSKCLSAWICSNDGTDLIYNKNQLNLECPSCHKIYGLVSKKGGLGDA